eukprot:COSAG02_NODE_411_length_22864_cov_6.757523_6_plen_65_part_00
MPGRSDNARLRIVVVERVFFHVTVGVFAPVSGGVYHMSDCMAHICCATSRIERCCRHSLHSCDL